MYYFINIYSILLISLSMFICLQIYRQGNQQSSRAHLWVMNLWAQQLGISVGKYTNEFPLCKHCIFKKTEKIDKPILNLTEERDIENNGKNTYLMMHTRVGEFHDTQLYSSLKQIFKPAGLLMVQTLILQLPDQETVKRIQGRAQVARVRSVGKTPEIRSLAMDQALQKYVNILTTSIAVLMQTS